MTAPRPPRRIAVGPLTYTLRDTPRAWAAMCAGLSSDPDAYYGLTDDHACDVGLSPSMTSPDTRRVILLHEVLHACAFASGHLGDAELSEEQWVARTAPVLLGVLRRNPALSDYLRAA